MAAIRSFLVGLACVGLLGWTALAVLFFPVGAAGLCAVLAGALVIGAIAALFVVRPLRRVALGVFVAFLVVLVAWLTVPPSHDRDWQPDVAILPYANIQDDRVTVHNVRNVGYRSETDFTVRFEDRELDLSRLRSLDLFLIKWGSPAQVRRQ